MRIAATSFRTLSQSTQSQCSTAFSISKPKSTLEEAMFQCGPLSPNQALVSDHFKHSLTDLQQSRKHLSIHRT
ncbi:hypothetical protein AVEN_123354-1 [Araneus ventricosus]|uniref:Uncharacterized protein n=1 Tax=Araneus ventricosus TaxID=182803 RepID=A0A4Y2IL88_ARAVE|nr:hypothetical protein AVEN_123354-1 [Araneus ventricosus]